MQLQTSSQINATPRQVHQRLPSFDLENGDPGSTIAARVPQF